MKLGTFVHWRPSLKELGFRATFPWHTPPKKNTGQGATKLRHDRTEQHHAKQAKFPTKLKRAKGNQM
jgi:hypothetical protein